MFLAIVTFDLTHSPMTFEELRDWVVDKAMIDYTGVPGVRFKAWFSDEPKRQWGAIYLVDTPHTLSRANLPLLPDGNTGPIGTRPSSIQWLDLEAFVLGPDGLGDFAGFGLSVEHGRRRRTVRWSMPEPVPGQV